MKTLGICLGLLGIVAIAYLLEWRSNEDDYLARYGRHITVPSAESPHSRLLTARGDAYVLELRGASFGAQTHAARHIWRRITETKSRDRSFLEGEAAAFPTNPDTVSANDNAIWKSVFRTSASKAVEYWPLPTFIVRGPPPSGSYGRPADGIADGRHGAGLGVTLFLWQEDEVSLSTQAVIERLFAFFDGNGDVPEAFVIASDGDQERDSWERLTAPQGIPSILNSHAALLVARSDRVEEHIRPHALLKMGDVSPRDTASDPTRFWHFYWNRSHSWKPGAFGAYYEAKMAREGHKDASAPGTMSTDWWFTQLPTFWEEVRSDRAYNASPFLPVRWTGGQLKKFDESPLLGYLHRPIRVALHDAEGKPQDEAAAIAAVREGWRRALAALPVDGKPQRIFYDTSGRPEWENVLATALRDAPHALDLTDEEVGYDLGKRVGDTGAVSALGQIALATVAGHGDGRVTATVNIGVEGNANIVIVTPADEAQRKKNLDSPGSYDLFGVAR